MIQFFTSTIHMTPTGRRPHKREKSGRYEDEIMSLVDSRLYAQTTITNLERSPLFILREKPKRNYSRDFREKAKLAFLYDSTPETKRKASDRRYDDIEKADTYKLIQNFSALVPSNQFKTEISRNYDWDEDDDDIFASISTQEILHQDVKMNDNFPHMSKFPVNKQITQGNQRDNISEYSKNLVLSETNVALGLQKGENGRSWE
ncbi:uncharacterized protein ACN2A1_012864 [Glossina fuscipes fuscipes]